MSGIKKTSSGAVRFSVLAGLAGTVISSVTQPVFVGGAGLGMSALVGIGTFLGVCVGAPLGLIAGAIVGAATLGTIAFVSNIRNGREGLYEAVATLMLLGGAGGTLPGVLVGAPAGAYAGYKLSESTLVEKTCRAPFNETVAKTCVETGHAAPKPTTAPQPK